MFFSPMVQHWFGYSAPSFAGDGLVSPMLGTAVYLYGGWPFLAGARGELRGRRPGMMLLIAMAITVAFAASAATSLGMFGLDFWWELAALVVIMLLGHWMEMRALGQARGALSALAELLPDEAERLCGEDIERVPVADLVEGDVVLVRPGARVPADGELLSEATELDESMVTGESRPVERNMGAPVVAGTVLAGSSARIRVSAVGDATRLGGIQRLVAEAESSRSRTQALADRAAGLLFYIASGVALLTFLVWLLFVRDADAAVTRTVTVLVISCPHALGLAIPLVIALATSLSARQGILVRERLSLERMREVDTVLFDKTGTLTRGEHVVTGIVARDGDEDRLLALAAAVERESEHPVGRAITTAALEHGDVPDASRFRSLPGRGVEATVEGATVAIGGPTLLRERSLEPSAGLAARSQAFRDRGASVLYVVRGREVLGAVALEDEARAESRQAVAGLRARGLRVAMITGDARQVASAVARDLGIDEVFAEVLPEDKDTKIRELQTEGRRVAMVGDGVNDAPALARADVGIAIGAGTDVAIEAAGIVLASDDPRGVLSVLRLSRAGYRKMLQNLGWAVSYNALALPIAAGVAAPIGLTIPPGVAAVLMSVSTVVVVLNAQLLRRLDLRPSQVLLPSQAPESHAADSGTTHVT
ncbi:MAG TPA: heavy metal translocating P-type ATPase [Solirubrobacteraceae bacterium]|nr:heavy metal translocating P-type ATPase [Solirubrobacteraceae bacterium]